MLIQLFFCNLHDVDRFSRNPRKLIKRIRNVKVLELWSSSTFQVISFFFILLEKIKQNKDYEVLLISFQGFNYLCKSISMLADLHHLTITHEDIECCWEFLPCLIESERNQSVVHRDQWISCKSCKILLNILIAESNGEDKILSLMNLRDLSTIGWTCWSCFTRPTSESKISILPNFW